MSHPAAILYHSPSGSPAERVKQAAEFFEAAYGQRPNLAAVPLGCALPQVEGLRVMNAPMPTANYVLVGVAEAE